tara:strand:+ start:299 stop:730 length:432 start_codon:yes stop_codon:yes gene_type:complete
MFFIILGALLLCNCLGASNIEGLDTENGEKLQNETNDIKHSDEFGKDIVYGSLLETGDNGIGKNEIPEGEEDLYMLKSQMVPPVCPACPTVQACPRKEKCPPCPPCARCPEPAFECKKVPNYSSNNNDRLPRPILADFSQFGM